MPRAFTEPERIRIRQRLMDEGLKRFSRAGVRALRIDELCRDIGIAKGSFYAFFPSKEALFFALADAHDERHKAEMMAEMRAIKGSMQAAFGAFFDMVMTRLETDPLMAIVEDTGELAYVMRHAPPDYVADNIARDRAFVVELADLFCARFAKAHVDAGMLEGVMTLMVALRLQGDYLETTGAYASTVTLLKDMFLKTAVEGSSHD